MRNEIKANFTVSAHVGETPGPVGRVTRPPE